MSTPISPGSPDWLRTMAACNCRCEDDDDAAGLEAAADKLDDLEAENAALRTKVEQLEGAILRYAPTEENLASTVRGLEFENEKLERENEKLRTELWSAHYQLDNSPRQSNEDMEKAFEWLQKNAPVSIRYMTGNDQWSLPPAYCALVGDRLFYGTSVYHAVREAMLNDLKAR